MKDIFTQQSTAIKFALTAASALLCALVLSPILETQAGASPGKLHLSSEVVCAPDSHPNCIQGPFTEIIDLKDAAQVVIDVYLVHTGYYEENEQSAFRSSIGELLDCGPIPPDTEEVYCGQVSGFVGDSLPLTIMHTGGGSSTGSHQQRYEITICERETFFPIIFR